MNVHRAITLASIALLSWCAVAISAPPRTEADAGVIVTNLLRKMSVKLDKVEQPIVTSSPGTRQWSFFYTLKPPGMPGGHFTVIVDEAGKTTYRGGK
jgi:hypothetical protein